MLNIVINMQQWSPKDVMAMGSGIGGFIMLMSVLLGMFYLIHKGTL